MTRTLDLRSHGLINPGKIHANLTPAELIECALLRREGLLSDRGALVAYTGSRTGRSPRDRFLVVEPSSEGQIWWGKVNQRMEESRYQRLFDKVRAYFQGRELFVCDAFACAEPALRLPVRVVAEKAWHALFAQALLIVPSAAELAGFAPRLTVLTAPDLHADPARDGTGSEVFVVLHLAQGVVLIGGTHYAGEIKKAIFTVLNYLLPQQGVFPMHCSANVGSGGDTALFFGLSGTGKTTLSADGERRLIGDDEHGWSDQGVFNIEGGCYAKCIRLSQAGEPQIWNALRFGSVLENVVLDAARRPDFDDERYTENTRAAYPVSFIEGAEPTSRGPHPRHILFLACDAFGVLPPLSKLTPEQAMYHFLSGYTAKVAGTETGVTGPEATFSTCFAAPFLPLHPARYAELLHRKLEMHRAEVWLVNTGWTGGPQGVGSRIKLAHTRTLVRAAISGALAGIDFQPDPMFGLPVPRTCPGVPPDLLRPRQTWADPAAYDRAARHLAALFRDNFKNYADKVSEAVLRAGPPA
jgi:phosphoenolpyruvate carboxykinase (ATP)